MNDQDLLVAALEAGDRRRAERRRFLKTASSATVAAGGLSVLAACGGGGSSPTPSPSATGSPTPTPTPTPAATSAAIDRQILNFALNLEYLEAQFYSIAAFGTRLPANMLTGTGTQGAVTGGRQVTFTDPVVAQYAREIAGDEIAHVGFLRSVLGTAAVAQPAINIDGGANGAFTAAARAAGVVAATATFDAYASDENFLLAAFIFEDVGVTAYNGAAPLLGNKTYLGAAAGILAAEAYHAGLIRTVLYAKGMDTASLLTATTNISNARDQLDGQTDVDQPIVGTADTSNIVPADTASIAFARSTGQVLNIVYLTRASVVGGGFFPSGVNGDINKSAINDAT